MVYSNNKKLNIYKYNKYNKHIYNNNTNEHK